MKPGLCVDTFRHPYAELGETFRWPSVHLDQLTPDEISNIQHTLRDSGLDWFSQCDLLPQNFRPNSGPRLHWIRDVTTNSTKMALVIRVEAAYLGGASHALPSPVQGVAPAFATTRVYFHAWILPIRSFHTLNHRISGFETLPLPAALEHRHSKPPEETVFRGGSVLFDSLDFSQLNLSISQTLSFGSPASFLSLFQPFVVEALALCANLIDPGLIERLAEPFAELLPHTENDFASVPSLLKDFWRSYYDAFAYERFLSPGGNPHWRFSLSPF